MKDLIDFQGRSRMGPTEINAVLQGGAYVYYTFC